MMMTHPFSVSTGRFGPLYRKLVDQSRADRLRRIEMCDRFRARQKTTIAAQEAAIEAERRARVICRNQRIGRAISERLSSLAIVKSFRSIDVIPVHGSSISEAADEVITDVRLPSVAAIVFAAATHFGFSVEEIKSARRGVDLMKPRHIAMYLAREMTVQSFPQIGRVIGGRDHTTVIHGYFKIRDQIEAGDQATIRDTEAVRSIVYGRIVHG